MPDKQDSATVTTAQAEILSSPPPSSPPPSDPPRNLLPQPLRQPNDNDFDIFSALTGAARLVERVVTRQLHRDIEEGASFSDVTQVNDDPILTVLDRLITSFKHGSSTAGVREDVEKLLNARDERSELINSLMIAHDMDRLPDYLKVRRYIEKYLIRTALAGELSPAEALAFLKIAQGEIDTISSSVKSGTAPGKAVDELITKADFVSKASEKELAEKFKNTSPQGREILRKIGHKLAKAARNAD